MTSNCSLLATLLAVGLTALAAAPASAQIIVTQLTDDQSESGCGSFNPATSRDGGVAAFESDCDLTGGNADGNSEIFRIAGAGTAEQITDTADCQNTTPVLDEDGDILVFESDCDVTGSNADGNIELFRYDSGQAATTQLTDLFNCINLAPSVNDAGGLVSFDSDCNYTGANPNFTGQIFQVTDQGVVTQLTADATALCDSANASSNATGDLVAFESDCDLTGGNEDFALEIFQVTDQGAVTQLTTAGDDICGSIEPASNEDGAVVAFESDCDFTGDNTDESEEIFVVETGVVTQLSDDDGASACESAMPLLSGDGAAVAYTSYCDPLATNADESSEIFAVANARAVPVPAQLTDGSDCDAYATGANRAGLEVLAHADCDFASGNADGSFEVFRITQCACGAPVSRFRNSEDPTTTDALFVLNAAVGSRECYLCECDVNNSQDLSTTDSLITLKAAVGQAIELDCPEQFD